MSMFQLTEYLLWKSIRQKRRHSSVKQEFVDVEVYTNQCKIEAFDGDMICRVCTNAADIPVTNRFDNTMIMSAIRTVANISINETDYYPKYVCKGCFEELKIAFYFKRKCEKSDIIFRKAISSETMMTTSSQPMVMHDFELILHQMKLRKEALNNDLVKSNESIDGELDDREDTTSPVNSEASKPVLKEENQERKHKGRKVAQRDHKKKKSRKTVSGKILKILKTTKKNPKTNWTINDTQTLKKLKSNVKKIRELKCRRCDVKFDTQVELAEHKKQNCGIYHPCPLCGKLVLNLSQHKNVVHYKHNEYTCHQCGKIYYSAGALANHLYVHKETLEYSCDLCPYKGKRKSYLVCHMRVHTGEHRYLCSKCPAKFSNPSNLKKHQLMHSGKKFECAKCKKMFRQKRIMLEHYDSAHMNIRYRCSICGRDLSTRRKLLTHELRVHKREKHKLFQELQKVVINSENE